MSILSHFDGENLPLWSAEGIADIRAAAKASHYPKSKTDPLLAAALEQARAVHIARNKGDAEAAAAADLERLRLVGLIEEESDRAADTGLALLALAYDRRPHEIRDLADKSLAYAPVIKSILERIETIERILAAGVPQ